jgi:hypothetical protein
VANASTIVTVNLIDEIVATAGPILAMTIGIDVITAATAAAMTGATTTVTVTATTSAMATKVIVVMITMMIVTMIDVMIDVARTTTVPATTTERSGLHRHHPKWGNSNGAFQKANREINIIVGGRQAIKSNRNTRSNAREIGHVNTENP